MVMGTFQVVVWVVLALLVYGVYLYNRLIRLRQRVRNAWSQIDVQLKRRHDLIPNLVETVKGYMTHERSLLENIARLRAEAMKARTLTERGEKEGQISSLVGQILAVVEQYPDLKASENFLQLQEELVHTENKIAFARQFYNDAVMRYNTALETFPSNLVASTFGFRPAEFLDFPDDRARPDVHLEREG